MAVIKEAEEILQKWNDGILRNARTKLAKELKVQNSNVSDWLYGRQEPSERAITKMSQLFNKPKEEIKRIFGNNKTKNSVQNNIKNKDCQIQQIIGNFEAELIKEKIKTLEAKLDLVLQILQGGKK